MDNDASPEAKKAEQVTKDKSEAIFQNKTGGLEKGNNQDCLWPNQKTTASKQIQPPIFYDQNEKTKEPKSKIWVGNLDFKITSE